MGINKNEVEYLLVSGRAGCTLLCSRLLKLYNVHFYLNKSFLFVQISAVLDMQMCLGYTRVED